LKIDSIQARWPSATACDWSGRNTRIAGKDAPESARVGQKQLADMADMADMADTQKAGKNCKRPSLPKTIGRLGTHWQRRHALADKAF
jgi:hypothetical protein